MRRIFVFILFFMFICSATAFSQDRASTIGGRATYPILDTGHADGFDADHSLSTKGYVDERDASLSMSVGDEGNGTANSDTTGNTITVTAQVTDYAGNSLSGNYYMTVWLSENATTGAVTSTAPDGGGTAENGTMVNDGTEIVEVTDETVLDVMTNSTGAATIEILDDDADNSWYLFGTIDGNVVTSDIIEHAL